MVYIRNVFAGIARELQFPKSYAYGGRLVFDPARLLIRFFVENDDTHISTLDLRVYHWLFTIGQFE